MKRTPNKRVTLAFCCEVEVAEIIERMTAARGCSRSIVVESLIKNALDMHDESGFTAREFAASQSVETSEHKAAFFPKTPKSIAKYYNFNDEH